MWLHLFWDQVMPSPARLPFFPVYGAQSAYVRNGASRNVRGMSVRVRAVYTL